MKYPVLGLAALGVACVALAPGQTYYGGGGYAPYGVNYHSSTAAEGYARGMADVVRSAGDYNLRTSEAAKNYTDARSKDLDNRLKYTQTYFEMRRINKEARAAEQTPRLSNEDAFRLARQAAPRPLTSAQLDRLTGRIEWPLILRDPQYAALTEPLNQLFVERAAGSAPPDVYLKVQKAADALQAALKKNINDYKSGDFIAAKKFIDSLAYEARVPAGAGA
jgi:hypothetical protein